MIWFRAIGVGLVLMLATIACGSSDSLDRLSTATSTSTGSPALVAVTPKSESVAPTPTQPTMTPGTTLPAALPETTINDLITYLSLQSGSQPELVHYATVDRPTDGMVRRMFISPTAMEVLATGDRLPADTIIMMEVYRAERDLNGQLVVDAAGRLVPGALENVLVRAQLDGVEQASDRVPEGIRNGDWDYVTIEPARDEIGSVNNTSCHACHTIAEEWDYLFTYPKLTQFVETSEPQHAACTLVGRQPCAIPGH